LSNLLRRTIERSGSSATTVREEVAFVRDYLAVERERFGDRLIVAWDIPEEVLDSSVPAMSLQPLVENAVKHAIGTRIEGGRITVSARRPPDLELIRLTVEDDGPGFAPGREDGTGLGNLRARLHSLYGERAMLSVDSRATGARVSIEIPEAD
jgi:LytS/YehU family sensor histidine kinase